MTRTYTVRTRTGARLYSHADLVKICGKGANFSTALAGLLARHGHTPARITQTEGGYTYRFWSGETKAWLEKFMHDRDNPRTDVVDIDAAHKQEPAVPALVTAPVSTTPTLPVAAATTNDELANIARMIGNIEDRLNAMGPVPSLISSLANASDRMVQLMAGLNNNVLALAHRIDAVHALTGKLVGDLSGLTELPVDGGTPR